MPQGEAVQARFEPIGVIDRDEDAFASRHLSAATLADDDHRDSLYCHAVRVHRLEKVFDLIPIEMSPPTTLRAPSGRYAMTEQQQADYAAWDDIDPLSIGNAAHLWIGIEPRPGNVGPEEPEGYRIFKRLKNEFTALSRKGPGGKAKGYHDVSRAALKRIAEKFGERPAFLFPEERDGRLASMGRRDQAVRKQKTQERNAEIQGRAEAIWKTDPTLPKHEVAGRIESDHEFRDQKVRDDKCLARETVERIIRRPAWAPMPRRSGSGKR